MNGKTLEGLPSLFFSSLWVFKFSVFVKLQQWGGAEGDAVQISIHLQFAIYPAAAALPYKWKEQSINPLYFLFLIIPVCHSFGGGGNSIDKFIATATIPLSLVTLYEEGTVKHELAVSPFWEAGLWQPLQISAFCCLRLLSLPETIHSCIQLSSCSMLDACSGENSIPYSKFQETSRNVPFPYTLFFGAIRWYYQLCQI